MNPKCNASIPICLSIRFLQDRKAIHGNIKQRKGTSVKNQPRQP